MGRDRPETETEKADSDNESVNIRPASPDKETRKDEKVTVKTKTRILKKLRSKVGIRDSHSK